MLEVFFLCTAEFNTAHTFAWACRVLPVWHAVGRQRTLKSFSFFNNSSESGERWGRWFTRGR